MQKKLDSHSQYYFNPARGLRMVASPAEIVPMRGLTGKAQDASMQAMKARGSVDPNTRQWRTQTLRQ
jgi:hypothetical protein